MQIDIIERARRYIAKAGPAISGAGGHTHTLLVAKAMVKGFSLRESDALALLSEWNQGNADKWSQGELEHKIRSAMGGPGADGYLLKNGESYQGPVRNAPAPVVPRAKRTFDLGALERLACGGVRNLAEEVDLVWLANRSEVDPCLVSAEDFLSRLYCRESERVLVFTDYRSQGDAVWPKDGLPTEGPDGVWFLAQPVDGLRHPNPRLGKMSRRSEESVTAWRWMVLESDDAPLRLWLGALARVGRRVASIVSSGGRSVHALIRVDAKTKREWDERKRELMSLVVVGADPGALSAVRLTRLPGCLRRGRLQKLLYFAPSAPFLTLEDILPRRDVVAQWSSRVEQWVSAGTPVEELPDVLRGVRFYEKFDDRLREASVELETLKR
jgi:hypothetical protein